MICLAERVKSTIYLDGWEVILNASLLVPDNQEAKLELTPEDPLIMRILFVTEKDQDGKAGKSSVKISGEGNDGMITFKNWNNPLGASIREPMIFAEDDENRIIALMCSSERMGQLNHVFLQVMRRDK